MIDELLHPLETLPTGVERHAAASALRDAVRADISPWVPHLERLLALAPASYQTFETVMVESYDGFGHATGYSFPEDHVTDHPDPRHDDRAASPAL